MHYVSPEKVRIIFFDTSLFRTTFPDLVVEDTVLLRVVRRSCGAVRPFKMFDASFFGRCFALPSAAAFCATMASEANSTLFLLLPTFCTAFSVARLASLGLVALDGAAAGRFGGAALVISNAERLTA